MSGNSPNLKLICKDVTNGDILKVDSITGVSILSTYDSVNSSTGSLCVVGGVSIQTNTNSVNVSNGGSLTVAGGVSIGKDVHIGGETHLFGNLYGINGIVIDQIQDAGKQWSALDTGSVFFNGGNVGIATTAPNYKLHVIGDIYASGNIIALGDVLSYGLAQGGTLPEGTGADTNLQWENVGDDLVFPYGNIGIKLTEPQTTLDISGCMSFSVNLTTVGNIISESTTYGNTFIYTTDTIVKRLRENYNTGVEKILNNNLVTGTISSIGRTWSSITWSSNLQRFVAVSSDSISGDGLVAYSNDGVNWTPVSISGVFGWRKVIWVSELGSFYVVGGQNNIGKIMSSTDGITWIQRSVSNTVANLNSIIWSNELQQFIAVGDNSTILYSDNTNNWTSAQITGGNSNLSSITDVCWNSRNKKFIAIGQGTNVDDNAIQQTYILESYNGTIWTCSTIPLLQYIVGKSVVWSPDINRYVMCGCTTNGGTNGIIFNSLDGLTWYFNLAIGGVLNSVIWCDTLSLFLAVGDSQLFVSGDSINWTRKSIADNLKDITWSHAYSMFIYLLVTPSMTLRRTVPLLSSSKSALLVHPNFVNVSNNNLVINSGSLEFWNGTGTRTGYLDGGSGIRVWTGTNANESMSINTNGNVGIGGIAPTERLHVNGNILATGNVATSSDIRFKKDIKNIDNPLDKVNALRGVIYKTLSSERQNVGVIAQEIESILPEVVHEDSDGYKSVAYGNIVGLLIECIKELSNKIERLETK